MHYMLNDKIVKSELAAKSIRQPNNYVLDYINTIPKNYVVLDYGCGKLRYSIPLSNRVTEVIAIDSKEQLNKLQIIDGQKRRLTDVSIKNIRILPLDDKAWEKQKYDLVFCTNVLSAIPFEEERIVLLRKATSVLKSGGKLFLTVQFRNSYYSQYEKRDNVERYEDGWLISRNDTQYYFYAPLTPEYIISLCEISGFVNVSFKKHDGSCFIFAEKI